MPSFRLRPFSFAVGFASFATIGLELMLTRIFSVTMYYHFAYMVISLALLGIAVSGVAIYLLPKLFQDRRASLLAALFMLLFSLATLWALDTAVSNPIRLSQWQTETDKLLKVYFASGLPFLFSGFALSLAIASARDRIGVVYAFDLVGAGLGCVFVIPALSCFGGPGAILAVSSAASIAAALFVWAAARSLARPVAAALVGVSVLVAGATGYLALTESHAHRFALARNPDKFLGDREIQFEEWNALSQITVGPADVDHKWIFIDADAATRLWAGAVKNQSWEPTRRFGEIRVASLVYSIRHDGTALVVGPGGGTDIISALYYGTPRVVGVEVNPIIVRSVMNGKFKDYVGHLYEDPRVQVVVDEGRSFIRRSPERYQSIQATLVDTWAASSSGAFTLSENNLYTIEAFSEFLDHLRPDGVLTITRWYDARNPKEFLRLVSIARAALEGRGVAPAEVPAHVVLATDNERRASLLLGKAAFSQADLAKIAETARAQGLTLLFAPPPVQADGQRGRDALLAAFLQAPSASDFIAKLGYDATAPSDDRPFFFYTLRRADLMNVLERLTSLERNNLGVAILLLLLAVSSALTLLLVVFPLAVFRRGALKTEPGPRLRILGYFLSLGFGFILVELGMMQRFVLFLGHPIYALAVVLAVLLASSGAGSALSGWGSARWGMQPFVRRTVTALSAVLFVYALLLGPLFHLLLGLMLPVRIVLAALLVLVPGLLMGSLLPSGVRAANALGADLVPWAWGLNGGASVVGSILAMILSMNYGFTIALVAGMLVYVLGMLAFPSTEARKAEPQPLPDPRAAGVAGDAAAPV